MMLLLEDVSKIYRMGDVEIRALDDINLAISKGEFIAIIGPSGSGKSTLMNIIGCLDRPRGRYLIDNMDVSNLDDRSLARIRNQKIGFIFQTFNLLHRMTALKNVELPLIYAGYHKKRERLKIAETVLDAVGLGDRLNHRPNELSGGQQQRVAIARAIVTDPSILLADEPTGSLDSTTGEEVMRIFSRLHQEGKTIILVTHEESLLRYAERIVRLKDGRIIEDERRS